jgi:hypothetical protein
MSLPPCAELLEDRERVPDRFHGERTTHEHADVQRLGDLGVSGALVEDLLDAVIDSVEAIL